MWVCLGVTYAAWAHRSQKLVFYPVRITDSFELPSVGAENWTPVLCNNCECSGCLPIPPALHSGVYVHVHMCVVFKRSNIPKTLPILIQTVLLCWILAVLKLIIWILILYQIHSLWMFLLFPGLPSQVVTIIVGWRKFYISFHEVQFGYICCRLPMLLVSCPKSLCQT